jgi:hypothetical protein
MQVYELRFVWSDDATPDRSESHSIHATTRLEAMMTAESLFEARLGEHRPGGYDLVDASGAFIVQVR